jgi:hypothetical protein
MFAFIPRLSSVVPENVHHITAKDDGVESEKDV